MEYTSRRLTLADYNLVKFCMAEKLSRIKRISTKDWVQHINLDTVLRFVFNHDNSWIIGETYLVVFDIQTPWYNEEISILSEMLVGKLGNSHAFAIVPDFLARKAREAGCVFASAGTALATSDRALVSLYAQAGFKPACTLLSKPS